MHQSARIALKMPFLKTDNLTLHYQTHGEGPPLLILGGLGDSSRNWFGIASQFGKHFHVIALDQRGAGQSDKPAGPYSIEMMAKDAADVIRQLDIAPCHVLGFSMGGKVAMQLALQSPELINKIILVSTGPGWRGPFAPQQPVFDVLENHEASATHYEKQYTLLYSKEFQKRFPAKGFVKFKESDPYPQPVEAFKAQLAAIQGLDLQNRIHQIKNPTLILAGSEDVIAPVQNAEWMHSQIKNSELKIYEGAGHVLQVESSKRFLEDVTEFLRA